MDGASSSISSAQTVKWSYDVFLSFRGEDTRNNFVGHLYAALDQAGIYTFKDDKKLERGKSISPELVKAIEESRVAVVVFSKNYGNSGWCLEELAKIIECRDLVGQIVLPVFYDVEPSDVRKQKRTFQEAFQQHEMNLKDDIKKVESWREALKTAASLSGWDVPAIANGSEAECIKQIVRTILSYTQSPQTENLIGMDSRTRDVKFLLGKGAAGDVCVVGIWGMGGIGKTTIARAVCAQISNQFDGCSILGNVRENSSDKGLQSLQEKLLSEILKQENFKVKDCFDGRRLIKERLGRKKVLIVLDDIDNKNQLDFLASREWFGPGSRIMMTTRDKHLISDAQEEYTPQVLTETQAMELFSRHAFKKNIPPEEFKEVSGSVVTSTGHLPLALKVLGSHFFGRDLGFWQSALKVLAKIPHKDTTRILKISYDGLNFLEQKLFLYIACIFRGRPKWIAKDILNMCGFEPVSGIALLIEKSLLTISKGKLVMHDLIQEMGEWIVRTYHPNTIVWVQEDIKEVMTSDDKLKKVEAIHDAKDYGEKYSPEVMKSMKELILLNVNGSFTSSEPTYFPEKLRYLSWIGYPFKSMRITKGITKLFGLHLRRSWIMQLQIENKVILTNLKLMNLRESLALTSFPDISMVPNLEYLNLAYCESLVEVHQSVLLHKRMKFLNLSSCKSLKILPPNIHMESLQYLNLANCESLESFPEVTLDMGRLLCLLLYSCKKLRALPPSIKLFTGLVIFTISLAPYKLSEQGLTHFSCLRILDLRGKDLVDDDFHISMLNACLSLEELCLNSNLFTRLPTFTHLSHLKWLDLRYCPNLEELPELPPLIQTLFANHCTSLKKIGDLSERYKWLFQISLSFCPKLLQDQESESHVANLLMKSLVHKCAAVNHRLSISVPGSKIPNWFTNQLTGNKIPLIIPKKQMDKIAGLAVCCLFSQPFITILIKFKASGEKELVDMPTILASAKSSQCVWIAYMSVAFLRNICNNFESESSIITFEPDNKNICADVIVECGVCIVYKDDIEGMTETGSNITQYDELKEVRNPDQIYEEVHHGRFFPPTFRVDDGEIGDHNTVEVYV